jgi:hypothetical protein
MPIQMSKKYVMAPKQRYIVWLKEDKALFGNSVRTMLDQFPTIEMVKCEGPDYAVVCMDVSTEQMVRQKLPDLCIEVDVQYHRVALR